MSTPSRYRSLAFGTPSHFLRLAAPTIACIMTGCREPARTAPQFTPMRQAIAIVEANRALIDAGLKARGSVRGHFRDSDGTRRHFDLDARLQVVPPDHMRIVMEHALGGEEVEAGMNREKWWIWVRRAAEPYLEGERGGEESSSGTFPLRAERLMLCLGLSDFDATGAAQRVVDDYQQIIFIGKGEDGRKTVEREIWLDRREPRLIRRVVFRDREGRMVMQSQLDGYAAVEHKWLQLPRRMSFDWPTKDAHIEFTIDRWTFADTMTGEHPAFVARGDR